MKWWVLVEVLCSTVTDAFAGPFSTTLSSSITNIKVYDRIFYLLGQIKKNSLSIFSTRLRRINYKRVKFYFRLGTIPRKTGDWGLERYCTHRKYNLTLLYASNWLIGLTFLKLQSITTQSICSRRHSLTVLVHWGFVLYDKTWTLVLGFCRYKNVAGFLKWHQIPVKSALLIF